MLMLMLSRPEGFGRDVSVLRSLVLMEMPYLEMGEVRGFDSFALLVSILQRF